MNKEVPSSSGFRALQENLLNDMLFWMAVLATPSIAFSVARTFNIGWQPLFSLQIAVLCAVWSLWVFKEKLNYNTRAIGLLTLMWLVSFGGALQFGPVAIALLFVVLSCFGATLFYGMRGAVVAAIINAVSLAVVGYLAAAGLIAFKVDYPKFSHHWATWLSLLWNLIAYGAVMSMLAWKMIATLRESEARLRISSSVFEHSEDGILITDKKNKIVEVNNGFTRMTGYSRDEVVGKNPKMLSSGLTPKETYIEMWDAIADSGSWSGMLLNRRKNGEIFRESIFIQALKNTDGKVIRYVGTISEASLSSKDFLTGLPTRQFYDFWLSDSIRDASSSNQNITIISVGIDQLNTINLIHGFEAGDKIIKESARILASLSKDVGATVRLGAGQFAVILKGPQSVDLIQEFTQHLVSSLNKAFSIGGKNISSTASAGYCIYPIDTKDADALLSNSIHALTRAKSDGGNCIRRFSFSMQAQADFRRLVITDLRNALDRNQIQLFFQPIVDLKSGRTNKAEALIRWSHPDKGWISPAVFIPIAEEIGLIGDLSAWLFREAVKALEILRLDVPDFKLSINISPIDLNFESHFPKKLIEIMESADIPGSAFVIEITEGSMLNSGKHVQSKLELCREIGIERALDDFGTGYSSLSYLKDLNADYLKIDQSFIHTLGGNPKQEAMCESIIQMAHKLGIKVIAEGVENKTQLDIISEMGADFVQGYYFSKPIPLDEFRQQFL